MSILRSLFGRPVPSGKEPTVVQPPSPAEAPDQSPYVVAAENIRTAARWLLTAFAAVGGVLIAGVPLTAIGRIEPWSLNFFLAAGGVAVALVANRGCGDWTRRRRLRPQHRPSATEGPCCHQADRRAAELGEPERCHTESTRPRMQRVRRPRRGSWWHPRRTAGRDLSRRRLPADAPRPA